MIYYVYWWILYPIYSSIGNLVPMNKYRKTTENNLCGPLKEEKGSLLPVNPQNVAATCSLGLSAGSKLGYFSCRNHTFSISCTAWCGRLAIKSFCILHNFNSFYIFQRTRRPAVTNRSYPYRMLEHVQNLGPPPFTCTLASVQGRHSLANRALGPPGRCHQQRCHDVLKSETCDLSEENRPGSFNQKQKIEGKLYTNLFSRTVENSMDALKEHKRTPSKFQNKLG